MMPHPPSRAPRSIRRPRENSAKSIGPLPARCTRSRRSAPSPQAISPASSSAVPGSPAPVLDPCAQNLHALDAGAKVRLEEGAGKRRQPAR